MKVSQLLMDEHRFIQRALGIIDAMASLAAGGEVLKERDVEFILEFLHLFGDLHHQEMEESILFPALLEASHSEEYARLCQITFEHNQQRSLLEGLEDAVRTHHGPDFVYYARRFSEVLRAHIQTEENQVFLHADALFSPGESRRVAQELESYGSPQQKGRMTLLLERLVVIEIKYGVRRNLAVEKAQYA